MTAAEQQFLDELGRTLVKANRLGLRYRSNNAESQTREPESIQRRRGRVGTRARATGTEPQREGIALRDCSEDGKQNRPSETDRPEVERVPRL